MMLRMFNTMGVLREIRFFVRNLLSIFAPDLGFFI